MTGVGQTATGRIRSVALERALVDAAERVLMRAGLQAVTVRAVAAEAGAAPMGVYNRFGSKDGLVVAVLVRGFEGLRAAVSEDMDADPLSRLRASGMNYRRFALDHPRLYTAMFQGGQGEAARDSLELHEHASKAFAALVDHVRYAMALGVLRDGDPGEVAQIIWSAVHGAVSLELDGRVLTADPAASYEALLLILVSGLGT